MKMQQEKEISFSLDLKDSNTKRFVTWLPAILGAVICLIILSTVRFSAQDALTKEIARLVKLNYVDDKEMSPYNDSLTIEEWLEQLDPHSYYLNPIKSLRSNNQLQGFMVGIGVHILQDRDTPYIVYVLPNSPAAAQGIIPGDRILAVDGINLRQINKSDTSIQERIGGKEKSTVTISTYNPASKRTGIKKVVRASINQNSISNIFMIGSQVGYAKFDIFSHDAHQQLVDSLLVLQKNGMKALILDLRDNGGGLLDQAVAIANEFLPDKKVIVSMQGKHRNKETYKSDGKGKFKDMPLYILINHNSASASEVLAAALQEYKRAIIIGERSFGKGLVQESFKLSNNGTLNLTIAKYYTPLGKSLQKKYPYTTEDTTRGVMPNYYTTLYDLNEGKFFPSNKHFKWATDVALYSKNWKALYPSAIAFSNRVVSHTGSDSLSYMVALGIVLYGPDEEAVLQISQDEMIKKAIGLNNSLLR